MSDPFIKGSPAQAYLAAIIASSDDAIISKDLSGNVTSWNPGAQAIFGYKADEVIGKHISILIPPDKLPEEDFILGQVRAGKRVDHFETMRRHKDGHLIPVSLTVSPIRDETGKIIGASKISRDISERIRAEQEIIETGRKKDEFLANMSHELRTPMNAVIGLSQILSSMDDLPEKAVKYVNTLKVSADNLMNLINDLLDFSRIESGLLELEEVEFNLEEQVERAVSVISVKAKEKDLALSLDYDRSMARHFVGDPLRVHQIVLNLLSNAVKFTDEGGVFVSVRETRSAADNCTSVLIKVKDTGVGIEPEKFDSIFDKFTQADASITRKYGGSGLGLAISKACVSKMGGDISVESRVGIGSTFTVEIPLKNSETVCALKNAATTIIPIIHKDRKNVLLVEDYEPNVLVAGTILEQLGYQYDSAENGMEALRKFNETDYDVILMDVQMHEVDGFEATRRIRQMEQDRHMNRTPIIAMTAHVREQDKDKCLEAGMDDFIPKPFEMSVLAQKIARCVRQNKPLSSAAVK